MVRGSRVKIPWLKRNRMITWSPKAEKAEMIICCTISGVSVFGFAKATGAGIGTTEEVADNAVELEALVEA